MKYLISLILFFNIILTYGQNIERIAYDTNGESEYTLFPEIIEGSVNTIENSDTIKLKVNDWIHEINKKYKVVTEDFYSGINKVDFKCIIPVGEQVVNIPYASFSRCYSKVSFLCSIEINETHIKYKFEKFYTNRRIVSGTGKSAGESNIIHSYRINSLNNVKNEYIKGKNIKRKKVKETIAIYDNLIQYEDDIYILEYESLRNIEKNLVEYFYHPI